MGIFLFELGSNSVKFHFQDRRGEVRKAKFAWRIAYDVCRTGAISHQSLEEAVSSIQAFLTVLGGNFDPASVIAFATGVFRDARNSGEFIEEIRRRTGVEVRVISADQEAALLKAGYAREAGAEDGFAFDLGSWSLQWVHLFPAGSARGSLPIGATRMLDRCLDPGGRFSPDAARQIADLHLRGIPARRSAEAVGTGGTVKSIAKVLGAHLLTARAVGELRERVERRGPPPELKEDRLPIFLPGLIVVERLLARLDLDEFRFRKLSIGTAILEKVEHICAEAPSDSPPASSVWDSIHFSKVLPAGPVTGAR